MEVLFTEYKLLSKLKPANKTNNKRRYIFFKYFQF